MARYVKLVLFLALLFPLGSAEAFACSCLQTGPKRLARQADVIFEGRTLSVAPLVEAGAAPLPTGVVEVPEGLEGLEPPPEIAIPPLPGAGEVIATFDVDTSYKGGPRGLVDVRTPASEEICGFAFRVDRTYTVFATEDPGGLSTNICTGTDAGAIDPARYGLTGEDVSGGGGSVTAPPLRPAAPQAGGSGALGWLGVTAILGALGGGAVLAARRPGR